jgi:hypothetical protein
LLLDSRNLRSSVGEVERETTKGVSQIAANPRHLAPNVGLGSIEMAEKKLESLKNFRRVARTGLTKEINSIAVLMDNDCSFGALLEAKQRLESRSTVVESYNSKVENVMCEMDGGEDEINREMESVMEYRDKMDSLLTKLMSRLGAESPSGGGRVGAAHSQGVVTPGAEPSNTCRLPCVELPKYDGDPGK